MLVKKIDKAVIVFASCAVLAVQSIAGGKAVAPAITPIAPIETTTVWPVYVGVGAIAAFVKRDPCCAYAGKDIEDHRYGGILRGGLDFNQYIGVEARVLKTFGGKTFSKTEHYGLFLKPQYHITDQMNIYGLVGYGKTTVDYTNGLRSCHDTKNGFSYGVGMEYDLSRENRKGNFSRLFDGQGDQEEGWGVWLDFQHLLNNAWYMHTTDNIITGGITYDF